MVRPRNRNWVWFFVVLALLALAAIGISTAYNLRQQLHLDALAAQREQWEQQGPKNYVLEYTKSVSDKEGSTTETFVVTVRQGQTVSVMVYPGEKAEGKGRALEPRQYRYYGMEALFDDLQSLLEKDAKAGASRAFNRAYFDPKDGHLLDYVRSVTSEGKRVHIAVNRLVEEGK